MTLWIVVGVFSIAVLGVVCSWILNARGGLEAEHRPVPDPSARFDASAQARPRRSS